MKLKPDSKLSQETLNKWWEEEHLPKLLDTGVIKSVWTWKAANPEYKHQTMTIHQVPDLAAMQTSELKNVPRTSDKFEGPVDDHIELESRIYKLAQYYEAEPQSESMFSVRHYH